MGQRHKHADVIIAWAEGKDIQLWDVTGERWVDFPNVQPRFLTENTYRIKPPAKKYRVALFEGDTGACYTSTVDTSEDADFYEKCWRFISWLTDWIEYEA